MRTDLCGLEPKTYLKALLMSLGLILGACQHFGDVADGCVPGFAQAASGCKSLKTLSASELDAESIRLSAVLPQNESEETKLRETQKMIAKLQEVEAARRSMQDRFGRNFSESSVRNLSTPTSSSSSFYNNSSTNYPRSSLSNSIFRSDIGFKDSVGYSSGSQ